MYQQYQYLLRLERELFRCWCTFMFRPESGSVGGSIVAAGGILSGLLSGGNSDKKLSSPEMLRFVQCLEQVNQALEETKGPYFLDFTTSDHPTMIDFVFASHVERMVASCAYWKGMNLRSPQQYPQLQAFQTWMDALETTEYYLAFKSDYYTHIKDIPPQYGPSYEGTAFPQRILEYQDHIVGRKNNNKSSWTLPLSHDDDLQPLYRGPPLPLCVLNAMNISATSDETTSLGIRKGSYESADPTIMAIACRHMAAWKLATNGPNVSKFASRGGPKGSKNPRKAFGAELADPYAEPDITIVDSVDIALRIVGMALQDIRDHSATTTLVVVVHHPYPQPNIPNGCVVVFQLDTYRGLFPLYNTYEIELVFHVICPWHRHDTYVPI